MLWKSDDKFQLLIKESLKKNNKMIFLEMENLHFTAEMGKQSFSPSAG